MNKHIDQMVMALVSGEQDKAREHLSSYFNDVTARIINDDPTPPAPPATPEA